MTDIRLLHLIPGLDVGGAEKILLELAVRLGDRGITSQVVSMKPGGSMREQFVDAGIEVSSLDVQGAADLLTARRRWRSLLDEAAPDLVQSWLYHADVFAALAGTPVPLVWGVHVTVETPRPAPFKIRVSRRLAVHLSRRAPRRIVCCAESSARQHARLGYPGHLLRVIPNGIDSKRFARSEQGRTRLRQELGLDEATPLVGLVGRFHPSKDVATFVDAAARLRRQLPSARFLLAGHDMQRDNPELMGLLERHRVGDSFHLLGARQDMPELYSAIDLLASTSETEALPLVLCEAMSCGTPCVATEVGDSALLLGDTGAVVPVRAPRQTAAAWQRVLGGDAVPRPRLRERIVAQYSAEVMAAAYEELYRELASGG